MSNLILPDFPCRRKWQMPYSGGASALPRGNYACGVRVDGAVACWGGGGDKEEPPGGSSSPSAPEVPTTAAWGPTAPSPVGALITMANPRRRRAVTSAETV